MSWYNIFSSDDDGEENTHVHSFDVEWTGEFVKTSGLHVIDKDRIGIRVCEEVEVVCTEEDCDHSITGVDNKNGYLRTIEFDGVETFTYDERDEIYVTPDEYPGVEYHYQIGVDDPNPTDPEITEES